MSCSLFALLLNLICHASVFEFWINRPAWWAPFCLPGIVSVNVNWIIKPSFVFLGCIREHEGCFRAEGPSLPIGHLSCIATLHALMGKRWSRQWFARGAECMRFAIGDTEVLQKLQVHQEDLWASFWAAVGESSLEWIAILAVLFVTRFFGCLFCGRLISPLFALAALRVHAHCRACHWLTISVFLPCLYGLPIHSPLGSIRCCHLFSLVTHLPSIVYCPSAWKGKQMYCTISAWLIFSPNCH